MIGIWYPAQKNQRTLALPELALMAGGRKQRLEAELVIDPAFGGATLGRSVNRGERHEPRYQAPQPFPRPSSPRNIASKSGAPATRLRPPAPAWPCPVQ